MWYDVAVIWQLIDDVAVGNCWVTWTPCMLKNGLKWVIEL
jgi:hypothetical protein